MKILIYGFKPYNTFKKNISEEILKKIKKRDFIKKIIFDVIFDKNQFISEIKKVNPDIIIGIGQFTKGKKIRIERKAINLKRSNKKEKQKKIISKGPKYLFSTLKIKEDKDSKVSYNAWDYVCNYSMYIILNYFGNRKFAFIHIPKDYNLNKGTEYIEKILKKIKKANAL